MQFTKMHGTGNDYIYLDGFRDRLDEAELPAMARILSDRHRGIGGDGIIAILPSRQADVRMRMFNQDGSEGEMCGNGVRCLAKYAYTRGLAKDRDILVETKAGLVGTRLELDGNRVVSIRVDMGEPRLARGAIPMLGGDEAERVVDQEIWAGGRPYRITAVSMGNPHCIIFVPTLEEVDLEREGPVLEKHALFPKRANVEFVEIRGRSELAILVWERGSGTTLSCGTGACATLVAAVLTGRTERKVSAVLPGGVLEVEWGADGRVYLTGSAEEVFTGEYAPR